MNTDGLIKRIKELEKNAKESDIVAGITKIKNNIYGSRDPVIQELIATNKINDFISDFFDKIAKEKEATSIDWDTIVKESDRRIDKVKSESKVYIAKKEEIEIKKNEFEGYSVDENTENAFSNQINEELKRFFELSYEERLEEMYEMFIELGLSEKEAKEKVELYDALKKLSEKCEKKEKTSEDIKEIDNEFKDILKICENDKDLKSILEIIENSGEFNINECYGNPEKIAEFSQIMNSVMELEGKLIKILQNNGGRIDEKIIKESVESLKDSKKISKDFQCDKLLVKILMKEIEEKVEKSKDKSLKSDANESKEEKRKSGNIENINEDIKQIEDIKKMEEEGLSMDDFDLLFDKIIDETDRPLTDKEGDEAFDKKGVEMDVSGLDTNLENSERISEEIKDEIETKKDKENIEPSIEEKNKDKIEAYQDLKQEVSKENEQTQLAVYKPRFTDRVKGFFNDIKNLGMLDAFSKNFISDDVQISSNINKEEKLKGIISEQEQINLAQEENIKKQNLITKLKETLKKTFGMKDENAEKIAKAENEKPEDNLMQENSSGFDFSNPNEELMKKTADAGRKFAEEMKESKTTAKSQEKGEEENILD